MKLSIPISLKLTAGRRTSVEKWLKDNNIGDLATFDWRSGIISFWNHDDAAAFMLVFNAKRFITPIEKMISMESDTE